ncbi:MAG: hypothetical protein QOK40_3368, partial [Miltoncostaeaceae bacterium]|nr:hypothetical protein [Miltoncostaeaceae bacterium]
MSPSSTSVAAAALRQDEGEAIWFLGVRGTITASRETTGGRVAVIEHARGRADLLGRR